MAKGKVFLVIIVLLVVLVALFQYSGRLSVGGLDFSSSDDITDTDNDGVQDKFDACPTIPGSVYNNGCPDGSQSPPPSTSPSTTSQPSQTNPPVTQPPTDISLGIKDYPMGWYDAASSGNTPNEINSTGLLWQIDTGATTAFGVPIVGYGRVYVYVSETGTDLFLYCLDENDGTFYWKTPLLSFPWSTPILYDGDVYVSDERIRSFDAITGAPVLDIDERDSEYIKPFVISDGMLFAGASGIFCLDLDSGEIKWTYENPSSYWVLSNIVYGNGKLFACTNSDAICIDEATGTKIWGSHTPDSYYGRYNISYYQGKLVVSNFSGDLTCLDASTGGLAWGLNYTGPNTDYHYSPVCLANDRVYFVGTDDGLFCYDVVTGSMIWKETVLDISAIPPILGFNQVFIITTDGHLMSHKISNGEAQWGMAVDQYSEYSIANDRVYLVFGSNVACYG